MSGRQSRTLAFPEFADCFCACMPNRLPDRYPVTPRYELARRIPTVVATRGNERLLCTMEHDGPHAWPVLELLEPLPDPYADTPHVAEVITPDAALLPAAVDLVFAPGTDDAPQPVQADAAVRVEIDAADDVDAADTALVEELAASVPVADVVTDDAFADAAAPADDRTEAVLPETELDASLVESVDSDESSTVADDVTDAALPAAPPDDTASLVEAFFADTADDAAAVQRVEPVGAADAYEDAGTPADAPASDLLPEVLDADDTALPYVVDVPDDAVDTEQIVTDATALATPEEAASDALHAADAPLPAEDGVPAVVADDAGSPDAEHTQDDNDAEAATRRSQA